MVQVLESRSFGRSTPRLNALLVCIAMLLPGFFAARPLATWLVRIRYPGELDSVEGRALAEMTLLRQGEPV